MTQALQHTPEGTASFQPDERVDFRRASEGINPYTGQLHESRQQVISAYAKLGVNSFELLLGKRDPEKEYLERAIVYTHGVGQNLTSIRQYELDTNWSLEGERATDKIGVLVRKAMSMVTGEGVSTHGFKMPSRRSLKGLTERDLLQKESAVGRELFGPIEEQVIREFFNLDVDTWIWHEGTEGPEETKTITTRYEIRDGEIVKAQDGAKYSYLDGRELADFVKSVQLYYEQVLPKVYHRNVSTGEKLTH